MPFRIAAQKAETLHCTHESLSCNATEARRLIVIFISSQKVSETLSLPQVKGLLHFEPHKSDNNLETNRADHVLCGLHSSFPSSLLLVFVLRWRLWRTAYVLVLRRHRLFHCSVPTGNSRLSHSYTYRHTWVGKAEAITACGTRRPPHSLPSPCSLTNEE